MADLRGVQSETVVVDDIDVSLEPWPQQAPIPKPDGFCRLRSLRTNDERQVQLGSARPVACPVLKQCRRERSVTNGTHMRPAIGQPHDRIGMAHHLV